MQFEFPKNDQSIIKVIGVGGGGSNAVNNMYVQGIEGVDFIVCNTDLQALNISPVPTRMQLGTNQTEGLGAGANPEVGRRAAEESIEEVREMLAGTKMLFVTAGMGGGTGTGGAPIIADMAREMGVLTVGIATTPFDFEGPRRKEQAMAGLEEISEAVDTLLVIDNNNLSKILGSKISMKKAFEAADKVLCDAARGIAEIITSQGYINVDFADVCTIMRGGGKALMGTAVAEGDDRALQAVEMAVNSPLLDNISLSGARGIVVNITASEESLTMEETNLIVEYIQENAGNEANLIYGIVYDENMADELRVTVVATRFVEQPQEMLENSTTVSAEEEPAVGRPEPVSEPSKVEDPGRNRLPAEERNARINRLNTNKDFDVHDPDSLGELERKPAYERRKVTLDVEQDHSDLRLSRSSVDEEYKNRHKLKENNSFLSDNPD